MPRGASWAPPEEDGGRAGGRPSPGPRNAAGEGVTTELNYTPSPAPIQKQEPEASGNCGKPALPLGRSAKGRSKIHLLLHLEDQDLLPLGFRSLQQ